MNSSYYTHFDCLPVSLKKDFLDILGINGIHNLSSDEHKLFTSKIEETLKLYLKNNSDPSSSMLNSFKKGIFNEI